MPEGAWSCCQKAQGPARGQVQAGPNETHPGKGRARIQQKGQPATPWSRGSPGARAGHRVQTERRDSQGRSPREQAERWARHRLRCTGVMWSAEQRPGGAPGRAPRQTSRGGRDFANVRKTTALRRGDALRFPGGNGGGGGVHAVILPRGRGGPDNETWGDRGRGWRVLGRRPRPTGPSRAGRGSEPAVSRRRSEPVVTSRRSPLCQPTWDSDPPGTLGQ